jgi:GT2 family glycosyltransferase
MSHTLSTIIVNYNAGSLLRKCVDSLLACPLDIEIIVVDNASSDASLDGLQDLSQVCVIRNPANMGFASACNIGVQASSAPFLLFLNPDCFFSARCHCPTVGRLAVWRPRGHGGWPAGQ